MLIGQRIKEIRIKIGLQQAEVAYRAGLTTSHMSHIETGQTKLALPIIVKIANVLSVSVDELLFDNLEQAKHVYDKKIAAELVDCDSTELQAFLEIILPFYLRTPFSSNIFLSAASVGKIDPTNKTS